MTATILPSDTQDQYWVDEGSYSPGCSGTPQRDLDSSTTSTSSIILPDYPPLDCSATFNSASPPSIRQSSFLPPISGPTSMSSLGQPITITGVSHVSCECIVQICNSEPYPNDGSATCMLHPCGSSGQTSHCLQCLDNSVNFDAWSSRP